MDSAEVAPATWQVRWTAINSPYPLTTATVTPASQQAMAISHTDTSANRSKIHDRILESASRIAAVARTVTNQRKRKAPATPRKKRPVPLALDPTEDAPAGHVENDGSPRPTKKACTKMAKDANRPLSIASSSRVNRTTAELPKIAASAAEDPRQITSRTPMADQDTHTQCAAARAGVHVVNYSIAQPQPIALNVENNDSNPQQHLPKSIPADVDNAGHAVASLPCSSGPATSSSMDGIDYLDDDESLFHTFSDPSPTQTHSTNDRSYDLANVDPEGTPPNRMLAARSNFDGPTPPSLVSNHGSSPSSTCLTPITPSPVIKPFIRSLLCKEMASPLPELPSIRSERRVPTCFRIAEVLRLQATLSGTARAQITLIELYARIVRCSEKDGVQTIQFADLFFPGRPPYLTGTCKIMSDNTLFDIHYASLITKSTKAVSQGQTSNKMESYLLCRAIVELKPSLALLSSLTRQAVEVEVLSIWGTDWEDVERVRGIVEPQHQSQVPGSSMSTQHVTSRHEEMVSKTHAASVNDVQMVEMTEVL